MSISCIIHVNTHRAKEGARVLEDVARFILHDDVLFKKARELRHHVPVHQPPHHMPFDLGGKNFKENNLRNNLMDLVQANSARIQEALRVLEETCQQVDDKSKLKSLRFDAYQLQQAFYKKIQQFVKQKKLSGLYLVIDTDVINLAIEEITHVINRSTVNLVQFRSKLSNKRAFLQKAIQFKELLHADKLLIINDHVDIALDIADGVHLGQQDYPLARARQYLPEDFLIGMTCHHIHEALLAEQEGASYLSVGCLFPSRSKKDTIPTSLTELRNIKQNIRLPICAIGGIHLNNLAAVLSCEVNMIAMISSIWQHPNPLRMIETMQTAFLQGSQGIVS